MGRSACRVGIKDRLGMKCKTTRVLHARRKCDERVRATSNDKAATNRATSRGASPAAFPRRSCLHSFKDFHLALSRHDGHKDPDQT